MCTFYTANWDAVKYGKSKGGSVERQAAVAMDRLVS